MDEEQMQMGIEVLWWLSQAYPPNSPPWDVKIGWVKLWGDDVASQCAVKMEWKCWWKWTEHNVEEWMQMWISWWLIQMEEVYWTNELE